MGGEGAQFRLTVVCVCFSDSWIPFFTLFYPFLRFYFPSEPALFVVFLCLTPLTSPNKKL